MKKILFLVLPLFFLLFLVKPSFAQNSNTTPLFQYFIPDNPVKNVISDNTKPKIFVLEPYTKITVQANSFPENNVTVLAFTGKFDQIKEKFLDKGFSPVISYYFLFINSKGQDVRPSKPLRIEVINSFSNTTTFYYPLQPPALIDTLNQQTFQRPKIAAFELPLNDYGFIIGVNKIVDKNNNALKPFPPLTNPTTFLSPNMSVVALTILIILILTVAGYLYYLRKTPKKNKRVEESPKIIVGEK